MYTFQEMIMRLSAFWQRQGCVLAQPYDLEKGAGTFNPQTFFRCLGPEPFKAAYVEPCRRPKDGRYGINPLRFQYYFQYQVMLKPSPINIQDLYLESLEAIGFTLKDIDLRFVHDDWEQPTLGAWGLGWEVWVNGLESSQFTYFQAVAGLPLDPITGELTYGLERLCLHLQRVKNFYDIQWDDTITYGDLYSKWQEEEWSTYNFEVLDSEMELSHFEDFQKEAIRLCSLNMPHAAYDFVMKASHAFNLLDTKGVFSVSERASYIAKIRELAQVVAQEYLANRKENGYPLLKKEKPCIISYPEPHVKELKEERLEKTKDFLLEIGSEEIPATFVSIGCKSLENQIQALLDKAGATYSRIRVMGTPRRIALLIDDLSTTTDHKTTEKKGPPLSRAFDESGNPTEIGLGFFRSCDRLACTLQEVRSQKYPNIQIKSQKDVEYLYHISEHKQMLTEDLLKEHLPSIILNIDFPKKMRWANLSITYARPIRWILSLFGNSVLSFSVGPIPSSNFTFGHRQLSKGQFTVHSPKEYIETLKKHHVLVDTAERLLEIRKQLETIEQEQNVEVVFKDRVLSEVVYLVEWPFLAYGTFDPQFFKAPEIVLISEMIEHQKYFPVQEKDKKLKNAFIITLNVPPTPSIIEGNQTVLSARLTDGVFLYEQDLKVPLEHFSKKLSNVIFQTGLGTLSDKVMRMSDHARALLPYFPKANPQHVQDAISLSKADLATEMVREFPELQGQIGTIYARVQGKPKEVYQAIEEQWLPKRENGPLPETLTGAIVSLADKIDNLLGFFAIGQKPTSSSDPFALRRQALGLVRIILDQKLYLFLADLLKTCLKSFLKETEQHNELVREVLNFIIARAKGIFSDLGYEKDEIESCLAVRQDNLYDVLKRIEALHRVRLEGTSFKALVEVYKRTKGQSTGFPAFQIHANILKEPSERVLYALLEDTKSSFFEAINTLSYHEAFEILALYQKALDDLFSTVKILDEDEKIKANRIALLQAVEKLFIQIADFAKLQFSP